MDPDSSLGLLGIIALVIVNAIISAGHAALVNAHKQHLRDLAADGNKRAQRVLNISEDATRLLTSRQFAGILIRFFAAGILTLVIGPSSVDGLVSFGLTQDRARLITYPVLWLGGAVLMLLFGELIPSTFASTRPDSLAMLFVGPMTLLLNVLSPITRSILWLSNQFATLFGGRDSTPYITEEEIKTLVDAGSEEGVIEDEEKEMIYSIFQFNDKVAREIMLPRIDIVALDAETPLQQALDTIVQAGHSRIPLYDGTIDRICGLLYAKDLLAVWRDDQSMARKIREMMRPAYFIPESKKAGALLEELQERKIQIAIVIDEYGGTAGLITIEDLVEEIVGEIQDEYDPEEEADYEEITPDEYLFDAAINMDDVSELLDADFSDDESDTLGGYILRTLDRVPLGGEVFKENGLEFTVELVTGRRIRKVRVRRLPIETDTDEEKPEEKVAPKDAKRETTSVEIVSGDSNALAS
ncbi:MAG: hemolysin family protein [Chloroflexota bacterium]